MVIKRGSTSRKRKERYEENDQHTKSIDSYLNTAAISCKSELNQTNATAKQLRLGTLERIQFAISSVTNSSSMKEELDDFNKHTGYVQTFYNRFQSFSEDLVKLEETLSKFEKIDFNQLIKVNVNKLKKQVLEIQLLYVIPNCYSFIAASATRPGIWPSELNMNLIPILQYYNSIIFDMFHNFLFFN
jgi:hypothetical protein